MVFLEAYHANWKLYVKGTDNPEATIEDKVIKLLGNIGKNMVGFFVKEKNKQENSSVVATHFNGEVNEGIHKNIFLEPETFETWGQNNIAKDRHFIANGGSANAWKIVPADVGDKANYELIIEVDSQRPFYIFLAISTLSAVLISVCFMLKVFKK